MCTNCQEAACAVARLEALGSVRRGFRGGTGQSKKGEQDEEDGGSETSERI